MGGSQSSSAWPAQLPEKNSYAHLKEHEYDDHPVWEASDLPFSPTYIDIGKLLQASNDELKEFGEKITAGLAKDTFVVLKSNSETYQELINIRAAMKEFLSLSEEEKKKRAAPEAVDGQRAYYSGYSPLHFENRHNRRDKEWRDVFQLRLFEGGHIPWPSESFKVAATKHYESQWALCIKLLNSLALSFGVSEKVFLDLITNRSGELSPSANENTNLSLFRYYDKLQSYSTPQKCMIHQDNGILTLLPRTDLPGLEIFHPEYQQWFSIEKYIEDDEILLYAGISLSKVAVSAIPAATHRVVRQPKVLRFSMPFELKPNNDAQLKPMFPTPGKDNFQTFENMEKEISWSKLQRTVRRADGIEPGSEEEKLALAQLAATTTSTPCAGEAEPNSRLGMNAHETLEAC